MRKLIWIVFVLMMTCGSAFAATVTLTWNRVADVNVTGYNVWRAPVPGGCAPGGAGCVKLNTAVIPQTAGTTAPTYIDATIPTGTTSSYSYVVRSVNATGESPNSNEIVVSPLPPAPTGLRTISIVALNVDGQQVAMGQTPIMYVLPRQTPPRDVSISVTGIQP